MKFARIFYVGEQQVLAHVDVGDDGHYRLAFTTWFFKIGRAEIAMRSVRFKTQTAAEIIESATLNDATGALAEMKSLLDLAA